MLEAAGGLSRNDAAELRTLSDKLVARPEVESLAWELINHGDRLDLFSDGFGMDDAIQLGCLRDLLLSVEVLRLCTEGVLSLRAPVADILGELDFSDGAPSIQVGHVLSRSAGLRNPQAMDQPRAKWSEWTDALRAHPRLHAPGAAFSYAGPDIRIAEEMVAFVNGMSADETLEHRTLPWLLRTDADTASGSARNMQLTLGQMSQLLQSLCSREMPADVRQVLRALTTPVVPIRRAGYELLGPSDRVAFTLGTFGFRGGLFGLDGREGGDHCGIRLAPGGVFGAWSAAHGTVAARDAVFDHVAAVVGAPPQKDRHPTPAPVGQLVGLDRSEVPGDYLAWGEGFRARVDWAGNRVTCDLSYRSTQVYSLDLEVDQEGFLYGETPAHAKVWLEFFPDPELDTVCLTNGGLICAKAPSHAARVRPARSLDNSLSKTIPFESVLWPQSGT